MTTITDRDRVWNATLDLAQQRQEFTVADVLNAAGLDKSKSRTTRRVMRAMEEFGRIEQYSPGSRFWNPGSEISTET